MPTPDEQPPQQSDDQPDPLRIPEALREPTEFERRYREKTAKREKKARNSPEWRAAGIGLMFASMVAGGCLLGWFADLIFDSGPTGLLIGGALGMASGGINAIRDGLRLNREIDRAQARSSKPPSSGEGSA